MRRMSQEAIIAFDKTQSFVLTCKLFLTFLCSNQLWRHCWPAYVFIQPWYQCQSGLCIPVWSRSGMSNNNQVMVGSRPTFCGSAQVEALVLKYWIGLERVWVVLFQVSLGMSQFQFLGPRRRPQTWGQYNCCTDDSEVAIPQTPDLTDSWIIWCDFSRKTNIEDD